MNKAGRIGKADRAGVPSGLSRDASQAKPLIPCVGWWETDPEFHEWIAVMHRQDEERDQ